MTASGDPPPSPPPSRSHVYPPLRPLPRPRPRPRPHIHFELQDTHTAPAQPDRYLALVRLLESFPIVHNGYRQEKEKSEDQEKQTGEEMVSNQFSRPLPIPALDGFIMLLRLV